MTADCLTRLNKKVGYTVYFDNGTDHHCKTLEEALEFAETHANTSMYGSHVMSYGNPTKIVRWTRVWADTHETVRTFKEEQC